MRLDAGRGKREGRIGESTVGVGGIAAEGRIRGAGGVALGDGEGGTGVRVDGASVGAGGVAGCGSALPALRWDVSQTRIHNCKDIAEAAVELTVILDRRKSKYVQGAKIFTPGGGTPARLFLNQRCIHQSQPQ